MVAKRRPPAWITPRQAFDLVGVAYFGGKWDSGCIDRNLSEEYRTVLKALYEALASGDVPATKRDGTNDWPLTASEAYGLYFTIHMQRDRVSIGEVPGVDYECFIFAAKLREYLNVDKPVITSQSATIRKEKECIDWLRIMMESGETVPIKPDVLVSANDHFGIGPRMFDRAWKAAIELTGRVDLSKPGRRPREPN